MKPFLVSVVLGAATVMPVPVSAADPALATPPAGEVLLRDNLGRAVPTPTNALPPSLLPPEQIGLKHQFPELLPGAKSPIEVRERRDTALEGRPLLEFFPPSQPRLGSYLASVDEFGNTAVQPGPLFYFTPFEQIVQQPKYWLSEQGLRYKLEQTFTFLSMTDVAQGDSTMGFYTFDLRTKWNIFDARDTGTAGWISAQIEAKTGLGASGMSQDPKSNLGVINSPNATWSAVNGVRIPELAWQQSLADGKAVLLAGVLSQRNYIDRNAYAQSARTEFMNDALVHSQVMPLSEYNFGLNLQWQPRDEWFAMIGASAGKAKAGELPWTDFNWNTWSVLGEFGYAPDNPLGLGPGVYRIEPFLAQAGGPTQGGLCFDVQQQLGEHAPFGWFGRFGLGGSEVAAAASAEAATGFVADGPLAHLGLLPSRRHDYAGIGFIWSQPAATSKTVIHENEFAIEAAYVLQLTATMKLQPDFQYVWDPAFNPRNDRAMVFQVQFDLVW